MPYLPTAMSGWIALLAGLGFALAGTATAATEQSLVQKAALFRQALLDRHLSPEGLVLYRVNLRTIRADLRRGTYPNLADTPTFTGIFAAASCTRASSGANRALALEDAERALSGLELLMSVTGSPGLLARAVRRDEGAPADGLRGKWFPGAAGYERFVWRGDVSFDQYANGLLPAIAECAEYFPERSRRLATDFARHLIAHDMQLVDPDGERTRYGDLSWRSGLGFNALAQLTGYAGFSLAAQLDPDPVWAEQRDRLRDRYRIAARSRRTNLRILGVTNPSNDLMAWHLYRTLVPLAHRSADPSLPELRHGMHRAWRRVRSDGNAYFALLMCKLEPGSCDRQTLLRARELLVRFPLEKRKLDPPEALDLLPRRWLPGRKWQRLAREPVPIELRRQSSFEWKSSPYRVERSNAPDIEYTGLDFLAAYWLFRALAPELLLRGAAMRPGSRPGDPGPIACSEPRLPLRAAAHERTSVPAPPELSSGLNEFLAKFRVAIIVLSGKATGIEYGLDQPRVRIGRGPGVDLAIDDPSLDRVHAVLEFGNGGFHLCERGGENQAQLSARRLESEDRFQLGAISFSYVLEDRPGGYPKFR